MFPKYHVISTPKRTPGTCLGYFPQQIVAKAFGDIYMILLYFYGGDEVRCLQVKSQNN